MLYQYDSLSTGQPFHWKLVRAVDSRNTLEPIELTPKGLDDCKKDYVVNDNDDVDVILQISI
jgi:hypothetical protein